MTPKRPESGSAESDQYAAFLVAFVAVLIAVFFLLAAVRARGPVGTPIAAMSFYTLVIAWFAYRLRVPWDRLIRGKFVLGHCLALAIVYLITTKALAAKPHLPAWFTHEYRRGSWLDLCLYFTFIAVAVCEYSWVLRDEGEEDSEVEQSG
jgi:hypothetical protein